jgi:hypothetical protein
MTQNSILFLLILLTLLAKQNLAADFDAYLGYR